MFDSNLTIIVETLIKAAELCREVRCKSKHNDSMTKRDESPVTIADYGSQAIICQMLKEKFPMILLLRKKMRSPFLHLT